MYSFSLLVANQTKIFGNYFPLSYKTVFMGTKLLGEEVHLRYEALDLMKTKAKCCNAELDFCG